MKNKRRIFKYIIISALEFVISVILSLAVFWTLYKVTYNLYVNYRTPILNVVIRALFNLNDNFFAGNIYGIIGILIFLSIYSLITYKKYKNVSLLVDNVEEMSKGNLDKKIEVKSRGDIDQVAENINSIVEQLKDITVEERKAQQTKTDLITNVSHDLRTPLTSVIGYLNLIEEGRYKDEVELMYYVDIAYEKSLNLNVLINDLFELTKMQNRVVNFNKAELNLVELIGQLISQFEIQFRQENMSCRIDFSVDKLIINADPIKLVRAFENLITNAMRYGSDGYYVDIKVFTEGKMAVVQVINYGETIPVVDLPHIFDRFYRVEKSRNTFQGGSGLGLAITKNIIEAHDGSICAISNNESTIFEVKIPYIDEDKLSKLTE
ncbi:sensor histidine kinase [Terrisporobacter mayombei]|uniref:histidine kinase n=1 Tax=Terrisporobacter mayombei TaxID=1541 RepID=A0ABY9Q775_9FIRM|nr:ATP-binding protein [Terrisporobacter mayombei]MCC3868951.1 GHKL domain-containing protein [Terrisporobacter mayombei]WMT82915.1 Sensor histidine kinase RcsC [Terrisporobacter mayombei]